MSYEGKEKNQEKSRKFKFGFIAPVYLFLATFTLSIPIVSQITPAQARTAASSIKQGFRLLKKGWVNDAIKAFKLALKRNPNSLRARLGLAISYNRAGQDENAWNAYQRVLDIDPENQLALKTIGLLGTYRQEWQARGIEALNTLLNINSSDLEARTLRALLNYYQGRLSESIADYQILLENNPNPKVILGAAETYSYSGEYQKSLELFNRYQATGGKITKYAAIAYGRTLRKTGNPQDAVRVLESELQGSNTFDDLEIRIRSELSQGYIASNQPTRALAVLDPLRNRDDATLPLASALNEIRKVTNNPNLANEVVILYRQALANEPNPSASLLQEIADVLSGIPQQEQAALQLYEQAALKSPDDKSLALRQLGLQKKLGLVSENDLKQRLVALITPLPQDSDKLQKIAKSLVQIDTRSPELIPVYQGILQAGVDVAFLNFRIAQMYLVTGDTISARRSLAAYTATPEGSNSLASQLLAAEIEVKEGNLDASAKRYEAVLATNPENPEIISGALRALAGVRLQQKQFPAAIAAYESLIVREPQNLTYQLGRTSVAYQGKLISQVEAENVLNTWLATQPASNTPAELYSLVGELPAQPEREALYNYLLEINPNNTPVQKRLVQVVAKRSPGQARTLVKRFASSISTQKNALEKQGQLSQAIGDLDLAGLAYAKIISQQPDDVKALAALGGIRFEQRKYETAQKIYSQVLEQKPGDPGAKMAIADLNAILDKPLTALKQMEELQIEQMSRGGDTRELSRRMQQIKEDFLLRRGFQPSWEDPNRRNSK
ncbi:MAG: tetratricopeptide repeat protein [Cyanobacteria bacterium P01_A01_bin.84]